MTFSSTTNELLTISKDGYLMFWDLESGERSRSVDVSDKFPGRCTRIYMTDSNAIVIDFDRLDSLAFTYDVKTGRELHVCGRPRLPSPLRGFVTGNLLCRQKVLGKLLWGLRSIFFDEPHVWGWHLQELCCWRDKPRYAWSVIISGWQPTALISVTLLSIMDTSHWYLSKIPLLFTIRILLLWSRLVFHVHFR